MQSAIQSGHSTGWQQLLSTSSGLEQRKTVLKGVGAFVICACTLLTISGWTSLQSASPTARLQSPLPQVQNSVINKILNPQSSLMNTQHGGPVKLMILTRYRSGSSFVGDLFSHHPALFYMFEPLHLVSHIKGDYGESALWLNRNAPLLLSNIYSCHFKQLFTASYKQKDFQKQWHRVFCRGDKSKTRSMNMDYDRMCVQKLRNFITGTTNVCNSFKHIAIKTIRLHDAHIIQSLIDNKVKVIHLVRDPRGQMNSIAALSSMSYMSTGRIKERAAGICQDHTKILNTIESLLKENPSLRDNYLLVRYEDVALNPHNMTRHMYTFAGLDYCPEVDYWIQKSTKQKKGNAYSTRRNSSQVVRAWTSRLTIEKVMAIQHVCSHVLSRLGYDVMWTKDDLLHKNPVLMFPNDQMLTQRHLRAVGRSYQSQPGAESCGWCLLEKVKSWTLIPNSDVYKAQRGIYTHQHTVGVKHTDCRSDTLLWTTLGTTFELTADASKTKMASPAAYLINDQEEAHFQVEGRDSKLRFAGAPLVINEEDLSDQDELINNQYFQVDLATPKLVGGVLTQGGFYEERTQGLFPPENTWVSQYVISYSNITSGFQFYRDSGGNVKMFEGNVDANSLSLNAFHSAISVRYVRYHPIQGHNKDGVVSNVNVRMSLITCSHETCLTLKINCRMTLWEEWSQCACSQSSCSYRQKREIVRVQACAGERCGSLSQIEACVPPEPMWKSVLQYIGISMAALIIFTATAFLIIRKKQRNRVEVIVIKETDDAMILDDADNEDDDGADDMKDFEASNVEKGGHFQDTPPGGMLA